MNIETTNQNNIATFTNLDVNHWRNVKARARKVYGAMGAAAFLVAEKKLGRDAVTMKDISALVDECVGHFHDMAHFATEWCYVTMSKFRKLDAEIIDYLDDEKVGNDILTTDESTSTVDGGEYYFTYLDACDVEASGYWVFHRPDRRKRSRIVSK